MITLFQKFIATWRCMDVSFYKQNEMHRLLLKAAVRCAYDLRHAAHEVEDDWTRELFQDRAAQWIAIFDPDGVKNYSDQLHGTIFKLECQVDRLKKSLKENGIEVPEWDDMPF